MTGILGTTAAGDELGIDLERLIGSHACIVANAGGGKSGLIRRLLEVTYGRVQHIVLDVEDEFYSLRERFDYVIAGGDGGDAPAPVESAASLARASLEHNFSLIVQLNDLGPAGTQAFVGRFLDALITSPRELWRPVLVVLDEAQRFAPSGGERTEATHGVRALTGQGRKRGFTAILASQRIAKIDPNVRGDVNNWLLGRVGQAIDRNTMADALGFTAKEGRGRLPGLAPRSFWAFGPALAAEPTLLRVADVETTPVRPGQAKVPTPPPPEALRAILQGLVTAESPAALEVKHQGSDWESAQVAKLQAEVTHWQGQFAFRGEVLSRTQAENARLEARLVAVRAALDQPIEIPAQGGGGPAGDTGQTEAEAPAPLRAKPQRQRHEPQGVTAGETAQVPQGCSKALAALAAVYPSGLTWAQWATSSGYKKTSGTFGTYRSRLLGAKMIERRDDRWFATDVGSTAAGEVELPPPPGPDLVRWWAARLPGTGRLAEALIAAWPHRLAKKDLAEQVGMAEGSGTLGTYISRLVGAGVAVRNPDGLLLSLEVMIGSAD